MGLTVGDFLSATHSCTVASQGVDFPQSLLSAVSIILQLYPF